MNLIARLKEKKRIKIIVLIVLFLILAVIIYFQLFHYTPPPEGALRMTMCPQCKEIIVKRIIDISDVNEKACLCEKCKVHLGYAYKCEDCQREFPVNPIFKPMSEKAVKTMGKFKYITEQEKCPNCGSTRTRPINPK
jgi:hypothetical protein